MFSPSLLPLYHCLHTRVWFGFWGGRSNHNTFSLPSRWDLCPFLTISAESSVTGENESWFFPLNPNGRMRGKGESNMGLWYKVVMSRTGLASFALNDSTTHRMNLPPLHQSHGCTQASRSQWGSESPGYHGHLSLTPDLSPSNSLPLSSLSPFRTEAKS